MKRFRSLIFVIAIFTFLALNFASLDDISTGVESNYTGEVAVIILSIPILGSIYLFSRKNLRP